MSDEWHYRMAGQDFGPVSLPMIVELAGGLLSADDEVRHGPDGAWRPARDIPQLRKALGMPELAASRAGAMQRLDPQATAGLEVAENLADLDISFGPASANADRDVVQSEAKTSDEWHARSLGVDFGPMPFADLVEMVRAGSLGTNDRVRRESSAAWIPASEFPELRSAIEAHLARAAEESRSESENVDVDEGAAADNEPFDAEPLATEPSDPRLRVGLQSAEGPAPAVPAERTSIAVLPSAAPLDAPVPQREIGPQRKRPPLPRIVAIAVGLSILAGLGAWLSTHRGDARGQYDALAEIHQEIKLLRERRAPDRDWKRLTDRVKRDVMPWIDRLDKNPPSGRSAQYELLRAGKDNLLPMLGESRKRPGRHEREFEQHLENAKAYLEGRPPSAAPNPDATNAVEIGPAKSTAPGDGNSSDDSSAIKPDAADAPEKTGPEEKPPESSSTPDRET